MKIVGQPAVETWEQYVPQVSLFIGPRSVGKWTAAEEIRIIHGISNVDTLRVRKLDREAAGLIEAFIGSAASDSPFKLVIVQLGQGYKKFQDALLKSLESETSQTKVIFISDREVSPTLASRAVRATFRFLSEESVYKVLTSNGKMSKKVAKEAAARSGGQIFRAFESIKETKEVGDIVTVLQLLSTHDSATIAKLSKNWTSEHTSVLLLACREIISGQYRRFRKEELDNVSKNLAMTILTEVRESDRPQYVVKSRLMRYALGE